jgi:DNA-binding transcriptional LysR family regulator
MTFPSRTDQLLNRLRMRQIALMLAIDEFRTLHAAARHLGMTQPAASNMLRELEDALGGTLFDRVGRGLALNPAGEVVLNTFRGMRNSMASLERELHELRLGSSGKLLIGTIPAVTLTNLSAAMAALKEEYPLLSVKLDVDTSDRLIELLRDGKLDMVIGRMPEPSSPVNQDCLFTPIGEEALSVIVACDHPLTQIPRKGCLEFRALLDYPWIFQLRGSPIREIVEQEFRSHHAALPPGLVETSSFLTIIDLVAHSRMIAVIPRSLANRFARHNLLRILPYTLSHLLTSWGSLIYRDRHINTVMQRFLDLIQDAPDQPGNFS